MNDKQRESIIRWRKRNPEQWRQIRNAGNRRYKKRHADALHASKKRYRSANRERVRAWKQKYRRKLRQEILRAYGSKCALCGEQRKSQLTVDHVQNDGRAHRQRRGRSWYVDVRREGFPKDKYRILCRRCNSQEWRKSIKKRPRKQQCPTCGTTL